MSLDPGICDLVIGHPPLTAVNQPSMRELLALNLLQLPFGPPAPKWKPGVDDMSTISLWFY